jgi:hypothetical protein
MSDRPTDKAHNSFEFAKNSANNFNLGTPTPDQKFMFSSLAKIAEGLQHMTKAMRATYILLEEVKELIQRQSGSPPGKPRA